MSSARDAVANIRDKVDRGILPCEAPERIYAGYGEGLPCDVCEDVILPTQVEWQFDAGEGRRIRLHIGCAGPWEAERRRRGWSRPAKKRAPALSDDMTSAPPMVYIVDDDASFALALQRLLRVCGFAAQTFPSAEAFFALNRYHRQRGCLLLDVHLRGMGGFELHERLSALKQSIPTVFMSALNDGPTRELARKAGAVAHLRKPFDQHDLVAAIRKATVRTDISERRGFVPLVSYASAGDLLGG